MASSWSVHTPLKMVSPKKNRMIAPTAPATFVTAITPGIGGSSGSLPLYRLVAVRQSAFVPSKRGEWKTRLELTKDQLGDLILRHADAFRRHSRFSVVVKLYLCNSDFGLQSDNIWASLRQERSVVDFDDLLTQFKTELSRRPDRELLRESAALEVVTAERSGEIGRASCRERV